MRRVGIRELRQNASKYIRLVKAGETLEVTERDVPVALLTPLPGISGRSPRERLIAEGTLVPGKQDWTNLPPPLPARPGSPTLSEILHEMREDIV